MLCSQSPTNCRKDGLHLAVDHMENNSWITEIKNVVWMIISLFYCLVKLFSTQEYEISNLQGLANTIPFQGWWEV